MHSPAIHPNREQSPLRELLSVAGPAIITMLSPAIMQFVDAVLVAQLGPTAVAAQGNGSMVAFVVMAALMGFLSVINTFAAQNFGAKRHDRCGAYGWSAVWLSLVCAIVVAPLAFLVDDLFRLLGHGGDSAAAKDLLRLETTYGGILLAFAVFPASAARGLGQFFYGVHRPNIVVVSTIAGNVVNVGASYALIFGVAGLPALGVAGAAIGTVIGHTVELAILLALFLAPRFDAQFNTRASWAPSSRTAREVGSLGWPAALHFSNEVACWGLFMAWVVPASVASEAAPPVMAASYVALNWMKLGFLPVVGLSHGVTALVGAQIGRGNHDGAARRAMLGLRVGMLYMGGVGLMMLLLRTPMTEVFVEPGDPIGPETLEAGTKIIAFMAVFQAFDALGIVMGGALRGAGDTRWPGVVVVTCAWSLLIGGGFLVGRVLPLNGLGPWLAAGTFMGVTGVALLQRFRAGRWRSFDLLNPAETSTAPPTAPDGLGEAPAPAS